MAGLEHLIPYIYHEKQQEGSMLCAQHALNSLLQGHYFTAPDLSEIARSLDTLEESYDDANAGHTSTNMDDTGFFSVQVLDNALKVWGLNLTRWRGEDMRPYQDHPQTQLGFILNLEQHWFTLRRFGHAEANVDMDEGNGHWFNLNSFLPVPEWVGKTYLGMVLQQSEAEGYSVFAVTQADPSAPLALPRTEADVIASTLPEPTSASTARFQTRTTSSYKSSAKAPREELDSEDMDFADEDLELQAALQASLMGGEPQVEHSPSPELPPPGFESPAFQQPMRASSFGFGSGSRLPAMQPPLSSAHFDGHADLDPVAASMERNRVLLQRMKQQQEFAQQEMWNESDLTPEELTALEERRERRRRREEEEESELRRAIAESEALAEKHRERNDEVTEEAHPSIISNPIEYDDDDAELQAALKASLEHSQASSSAPTPADDTESVLSDSTSAAGEVVSQTPGPTLDEIRQRRLARFGQ